MEQAIWAEQPPLQRQGGGKENKEPKEGARKGVEAYGGDFLDMSWDFWERNGSLTEKSHFTVSNNRVRRVLESSAQFCIPTAVAPSAVFLH